MSLGHTRRWGSWEILWRDSSIHPFIRFVKFRAFLLTTARTVGRGRTNFGNFGQVESILNKHNILHFYGSILKNLKTHHSGCPIVTSLSPAATPSSHLAEHVRQVPKRRWDLHQSNFSRTANAPLRRILQWEPPTIPHGSPQGWLNYAQNLDAQVPPQICGCGCVKIWGILELGLEWFDVKTCLKLWQNQAAIEVSKLYLLHHPRWLRFLCLVDFSSWKIKPSNSRSSGRLTSIYVCLWPKTIAQECQLLWPWLKNRVY